MIIVIRPTSEVYSFQFHINMFTLFTNKWIRNDYSLIIVDDIPISRFTWAVSLTANIRIQLQEFLLSLLLFVSSVTSHAVKTTVFH